MQPLANWGLGTVSSLCELTIAETDNLQGAADTFGWEDATPMERSAIESALKVASTLLSTSRCVVCSPGGQYWYALSVLNSSCPDVFEASRQANQVLEDAERSGWTDDWFKKLQAMLPSELVGECAHGRLAHPRQDEKDLWDLKLTILKELDTT